MRTLTGHRSNVISVDFHPFGEFFASGSLDCNTKIWDIRRKGCIHTYKGHDRGVSVAKFSPDGKWVLSGGQDGRVKLWDLTAGSCWRELPARARPRHFRRVSPKRTPRRHRQRTAPSSSGTSRRSTWWTRASRPPA